MASFRADLLAARLFAQAAAKHDRLLFRDCAGTFASDAFDAAAAFMREHARRNPETGEPRYDHPTDDGSDTGEVVHG